MKKVIKKLKPKADSSSETPVEKSKFPSFMPMRFGLVYLFVAGLSIALFAQSAYLQVADADRLINEADKRSLREEKLPFTRGRILDRDGRLLSVSGPMFSLTLDPKAYFDSLIQRDNNRWKALAKEMGSSPSKIQSNVAKYLKAKKEPGQAKKYDPYALINTRSEDYWTLLARVTGLNYNDLIDKVRNNPNSEFLNLERYQIQLNIDKLRALAKSADASYDEWRNKLYNASEQRFIYLVRHQTETVKEYAKELQIPALVIKRESRRFYPMVEDTAQLIGFTDQDDKFGAEGLERSFNSLLIGKDGKKVVRKDRKGNAIEQIRDEKQYDPQDVVLSIDSGLQSMAYRTIKKAVSDNKAESGTAVLLDVQTGEILAMATAPSYNPNNRREFKAEFARNRAITDTFEPGSTVKPFTVLTALQHKQTYLGEVIGTRPFTLNGHTITDVAPRESLTLTGILQKSSNIGVSRLALRLPYTALPETYSKVGFGKDTGLGLGEERGSNGDRKRWSDLERATLAYGYGLNVTPLQLARAYATLGSFGIYRPVSITKVDPPVIGERVLPEKNTRDVVHMMESVAQKGEGGQRAAIDGYRVAVKTGTAKKTIQGQKGYADRYLAYTAGIAPASDPRFALVVLINDPKAGAYYGGAVAAPLFSKIMEYALKTRNIKPDNISDNSRHAVRELKSNNTN